MPVVNLASRCKGRLKQTLSTTSRQRRATFASRPATSSLRVSAYHSFGASPAVPYDQRNPLPSVVFGRATPAAAKNAGLRKVESLRAPTLVASGWRQRFFGGGKMAKNPVSVKEVEEARDSWIAAVKKGSVDDTVALYDPVQGKLLGTVDLDDVRTGKDKIREYFVGFLQTNYDTVVPNFPATIADGDIQQLGPDTVAYSGYYKFDLAKDGSGKVANAKFTYIYRRGDDGKLKILLHNSGFTPAGAVAK